ncbi:MAG: cupin domain-containing protein [Gammaproteobacteria bacterium]|nr:cupin domain-containing protein [Gammaproteobacteria bacterium]
MDIKRANARPTKVAPEDKFTGTVYQDEVVVGTTPSRMRATNVSFTPGARTAWHQHPVGQVLYVVSGVGRVQLEGEPVQELRPGDTAMIPPNTRHWHGAAPDRFFVHLAMSEVDDKGGGTDWFEKVSDDQYKAAVAPVE